MNVSKKKYFKFFCTVEFIKAKSVFTRGKLQYIFIPIQELLDCLKSELTGNFEKVVVGLMMPGPVYDAYELRNAIKVSEDRKC